MFVTVLVAAPTAFGSTLAAAISEEGRGGPKSRKDKLTRRDSTGLHGAVAFRS